VKAVLDERHRRLRLALSRTDRASKDAAIKVERLAKLGGLAVINEDLDALKRESHRVAKLGGEIDDQVAVRYGESLLWHVALFVMLLLTIGCSTVNGLLMSAFMREVVAGRVAGVPLASLASWFLVLLELGCGIALGFVRMFKSPGGRIAFVTAVLAVAAVLAFVESFIFGNFSANMELELPIFDDRPWLVMWMEPLGAAFVLASVVFGFLLHRVFEEVTGRRGEYSLKREVKAANAYVRSLPRRWELIEQKADRARHAIGDYVSALGEQGGALSGSLTAMQTKRKALAGALKDARIDDWPQVLDGAAGDIRTGWAQNLFAFVATVLACGV